MRKQPTPQHHNTLHPNIADPFARLALESRNIDCRRKQYNSGFWDVKFEDISLNNKTVQSNITAILDSGTTNLVGPEGIVRDISEALDAMCIAFKKSDILEYESNPSLGFWHIPKKLYPCATSDTLDPAIYVTYGDIRLGENEEEEQTVETFSTPIPGPNATLSHHFAPHFAHSPQSTVRYL